MLYDVHKYIIIKKKYKYWINNEKFCIINIHDLSKICFVLFDTIKLALMMEYIP